MQLAVVAFLTFPAEPRIWLKELHLLDGRWNLNYTIIGDAQLHRQLIWTKGDFPGRRGDIIHLFSRFCFCLMTVVLSILCEPINVFRESSKPKGLEHKRTESKADSSKAPLLVVAPWIKQWQALYPRTEILRVSFLKLLLGETIWLSI
jgi:hypothetical protein